MTEYRVLKRSEEAYYPQVKPGLFRRWRNLVLFEGEFIECHPGDDCAGRKHSLDDAVKVCVAHYQQNKACEEITPVFPEKWAGPGHRL